MKKRILSILLCFCMAISLLPMSALAADYNSWEAATADGVTLTEGADAITLDGTAYTYKGDASTSGITLYTSGGGSKKALTEVCCWKAGSGYVLYKPTVVTFTAQNPYQDGSTGDYTTSAEVTLHNAEISTVNASALDLPFTAPSSTLYPVPVTIKVEGTNSLTSGSANALSHDAGDTAFTGGGTLSITGSLRHENAVTIQSGVQVTVSSSANKQIAGNLTVTGSSSKLTIASGADLMIGRPGVTPTATVTVENGAVLENNGTLCMAERTKNDPGITGEISGSGGIMLYNKTYTLVDGVFYADKGDGGGGIKMYDGDPMTSRAALTEACCWKAGGGYVLYKPTVENFSSDNPHNGLFTGDFATSAEVTLHGATISASGSTALVLPNNYNGGDIYPVPVTVHVEGTNSLTTDDVGNFALLHEGGETIFTGGGTLSLTNSATNAWLNTDGAVTIDSGTQVTMNGGSSIRGNLTVTGSGSKLTVASGTTLEVPAITVENGGVLENNGTLCMYNKTKDITGITGEISGSGAFRFGSESQLYCIVNGEFIAYGGDVETNGLDLSSSVPTVTTRYKAGNGYVLFTPTDSTTDPATPATLTLYNATINSTGGDAALVLGENYVVKLEGDNTITHKTRVTYCNGGALTVIGPGTLHTSGSVGLSAAEITVQGEANLDISYPNGHSGINSSAGDVVIKHSTVTVRSNNSGSGVGSGAILANDNQGINGSNANVIITNSKIIAVDTTGKAINANFGGVTLTDSSVVAIGKEDSFGAIYNDYDNGHYLVVDGGTLYVKNTGNSYDTSYSNHDTAINGAVIYCGGEYSSLFGSSGKNAQFSNCSYDEGNDKVINVGAGRLCGDWTYSTDLPLPDTAQVTLKSPGTLTIPPDLTADIPNILRIDNGATLQNNGVLNIPCGMILYGESGGNGTLNGVVMTASDTTYTYTTYGNAVYSDFVDIGMITVNTTDTENKLVVPENTTLTIPTNATLDLAINSITADNLTDYFTVSGKVVNNGLLELPQGITMAQIRALPLSGTGVVEVDGQYYTNDGVAVTEISGGLDLTTGDHSGKTLQSDGYTFSDNMLTLGNAYVTGSVTLPESATVNTTANSTINGSISPASNGACDLTFSGAGSLAVDGNIGNAQGGIMTVSGGAHLTVNGSVNICTSGGADGTLNVTGAGTALNVSSSSGYAVFFETVNVGSGASLTAKSEGSFGLEALGGGVHVTGGSTLETGCDYGVYIIGGKLEVDSTSKLITNGAVAPFCIVDTTSGKAQSDVLSLSGTPDGTEIKSATGTKGKYWSLVPTGGILNVVSASENHTPVTLTGAKTGPLTFVKAASSGGSSGGSVSTVSYKLSFETNGGSKISEISKENGTTLDLTNYKSTRDGYDFGGWYSDKALTEKVTSVKLTKNTTIYAKWTEKPTKVVNPFADVSENAYYHDAVLWAVQKNVTSGTTDTAFSPDMLCTRAQMVTFLWRTMGSPEPTSANCPFTDVSKDAYYYKAVLWAVEKGITAGASDTAFNPDATVTREQSVTFMWRAAGKPSATSANPFTDVSKDDYYYNAVLWAVEKGITQGTSSATFSPSGSCTRAQIVTFLYRYIGN